MADQLDNPAVSLGGSALCVSLQHVPCAAGAVVCCSRLPWQSRCAGKDAICAGSLQVTGFYVGHCGKWLSFIQRCPWAWRCIRGRVAVAPIMPNRQYVPSAAMPPSPQQQPSKRHPSSPVPLTMRHQDPVSVLPCPSQAAGPQASTWDCTAVVPMTAVDGLPC